MGWRGNHEKCDVYVRVDGKMWKIFRIIPILLLKICETAFKRRIDDFETNYEFMKFTEFRIVDDVGSSAFYI